MSPVLSCELRVRVKPRRMAALSPPPPDGARLHCLCSPELREVKRGGPEFGVERGHAVAVAVVDRRTRDLRGTNRALVATVGGPSAPLKKPPGRALPYAARANFGGCTTLASSEPEVSVGKHADRSSR